MSAPRPTELLLLVLLVMGVGLHLVARPDYSRRNFEYCPDMAETPGYEAQDPNPVFADGKTLQTPDPRVVPRGFTPLFAADGRPLEETKPDWKLLTDDERRGWDGLLAHDAFDALDDAARARDQARGRDVFLVVCAACHGETGLGGTPVTKRGVPPPPSLLESNVKAMSDGRLYRVVTVGQGNMPSHANMVARADRWRVIRHLRTLQEPKE